MPEKFNRGRSARIACVLGLALALSGCAPLPNNAPVINVNYRACLFVQGDANSVGINELATYGLNQAVVTYGVQKTISVIEPSEFDATISKSKKCNLVLIAGSSFNASIPAAVQAHPEINFVLLTDGEVGSLFKATPDNLAVYQVDQFEAGLLAGHLAASFSQSHEVLTVCDPKSVPKYLAGVRAGVAAFDLQTSTKTVLATDRMSTIAADVLVPLGCTDQIPDAASFQIAHVVVGYGRDLFFNQKFADSPARVATTIEPQVIAKVLEVIASDLEGDFIGGVLGSMTATFGNGGLALAAEHEVNLSGVELDRLKTAATDYETSSKK